MQLTIANSLDVPKPSCWPISMVRFGTVPRGTLKGEPLFRIVYAPTVKKLVFGQYADGYIGGRVRTSYPQIGNKWILEKWITGYEDTKLTPREYQQWGPRDPQSGMLINGPYPHDGVYNHCWTFDKDTLQGGIEGAVEKIIGMIRQGEGRSFSQIKAANRALDEKAEKEAAHNRFLRVRETEPLYGVRAASFAGRPKSVNHKSQRMPVSANELGLPVRRGSVVSMKGPKVNINGGI